ncbi:MAG: MATE family efflux transporter [Alphaproteobacteria bacterium]|jgi:MATE family multidrug resistance protein|nr:MATE family efflux transporter [Alphaproteobacteria bacterium]
MSARTPAPTPRREVFALAWPLILANISVPLLGMVDTAVVGHLPEPHHLGAVALGAATFAAAYLVFASVRMGTTGLTAQAVGAGDGAEARACLVRPLALALVVGAALVLASPLITGVAVAGFGPGVAVADGLATYVAWRIAGAPAALATFVLLGWLIGNHDTKSQLVVLVFTNTLNALLSVVFVLGLGWGVAGVALATAIAEWIGFAVALALAARRWRRLPGGFDRAVVGARAAFVRLFRVNGDLIVRTLFLEATFLGFAAFSARQGEVLLAANAVLNNLLMLQAYALDGFAFAAEALVGRAVGRRDPRALDRALAAAAWWSAGFAVAIALAYATAGFAVVRLLTGIAEVRAAADVFLLYAAAVPLIGVWAYLFDGLFSGATQTRELRDGSAVATLVFFATAWPSIQLLANHGLWLALLAFLGARSLWFGWRWRVLRAAGRFTAAGAG